MKFFYPEFLWLLFLIPVFILLGIRRFFDGERFIRLSGQSQDPDRCRLVLGIKLFLMVMTFLAFFSFMIMALAEPVMGTRPVLEDNEGSDVCLVVDLSRSMLAEDMGSPRIQLVRDALHLVLNELTDSRFSLVVFAGEAYTLVPMTEDRSALDNSLLYIQPSSVTATGSNLEKALETAAGLFPEGVNRRRLVIVFSDGEALKGTAARAARTLRDLNIKIYSFGVGTVEGGVIPLPDDEVLLDNRGNPVVTRLHREGMESLADITGGVFFSAEDPDGLARLIEIINNNTTLAKRTGIRYHRYGNYQIYLFLSLIFLLLNFLCRNIRWKNSL